MEIKFYFNSYLCCFEYYNIIACGLTDLNTWTFESSKKKSLLPFKIFIWIPLLYTMDSTTETYYLQKFLDHSTVDVSVRDNFVTWCERNYP